MGEEKKPCQNAWTPRKSSATKGLQESGWVVEEELADQKGKAGAVNCQKPNLTPVSRKELSLFPSTVQTLFFSPASPHISTASRSVKKCISRSVGSLCTIFSGVLSALSTVLVIVLISGNKPSTFVVPYDLLVKGVYN